MSVDSASAIAGSMIGTAGAIYTTKIAAGVVSKAIGGKGTKRNSPRKVRKSTRSYRRR